MALKVLHLSTGLNGGASLSARRLHEGLQNQEGCFSQFCTLEPTSEPGYLQFQQGSRWRDRIERMWRRGWLQWEQDRLSEKLQADHEVFTLDRTVLVPDVSEIFFDYDIIHLHWVATFVDFSRTIYAISAAGKKLVWTLHDGNAFTGGCHYPGTCLRYSENCGHCPVLDSSSDQDFSRAIWQRKKRAYLRLKEENVHLVTPSAWLGKHLQKSTLLGSFPRSVIPYGLNLERFKPGCRKKAKEKLGIKADAKVILFVAAYIDSPRKGFHFLQKSLTKIANIPDLIFLVIGALEHPIQVAGHVVLLGKLRPGDEKMVLAYQAADIFVITSTEDNLPNTVLEAMACGAVVVGFSAGGIPEMVEHEVSGMLVPVGNSEELARVIRLVLTNITEHERLSINAHKKAVSRYSLTRQAASYLKIYCNLTKEGTHRSLT